LLSDSENIKAMVQSGGKESVAIMAFEFAEAFAVESERRVDAYNATNAVLEKAEDSQ
jgi:hypothetical protein